MQFSVWRRNQRIKRGKMCEKFEIVTLLLAALLAAFSNEVCAQFTLTDLSTSLPSCDLRPCARIPYKVFRQIGGPTWKLHKRTKDVEGAQCESVKFSDFVVDGTTFAFNLTATLQLQPGPPASRPGTPRRYIGKIDQWGYVTTFRTFDGPLTWNWCLYNYYVDSTYISQLCTTTAQGNTIGMAFSGYTYSPHAAEHAVQSVPALRNYDMRLSTYGRNCPFIGPARRDQGY